MSKIKYIENMLLSIIPSIIVFFCGNDIYFSIRCWVISFLLFCIIDCIFE